jgi:hypothetical protein
MLEIVPVSVVALLMGGLVVLAAIGTVENQGPD